MNNLTLRVGDLITLNDKAREWTRGLVFTVSQVKNWGVICSTELKAGPAEYSATWEEVEARVVR